MSAVKSQTRTNLLGSSQFQAGAQQAIPSFGHQRLAHNPAQLCMQQNLRRVGHCAPYAGTGFGGGASSNYTSSGVRIAAPMGSMNPVMGGPNSSNFAFVTSHNSAAASNGQDSNLAVDASSEALNEKTESIKLLKAYFSDFSDERLQSVLEENRWDTQHALEKLMEQTFAQQKQTNQRKLTETNHLYMQASRSATGNPAPPTQQAQGYQVPKPSKRRRQQFNADSQQNTQMQSANGSPKRENNQISKVSHNNPVIIPQMPQINASAPRLTVPQQPQPQIQQPAQAPSQQPEQNPQELKQARKELIASQLSHILFNQKHLSESAQQSYILQAWNSYEQQTKSTESSKPSKEWLEKQQRLEHENAVMKRGFRAMLKKQSDWCKANEEIAKLKKEKEQMYFELNAALSESKAHRPMQQVYRADGGHHDPNQGFSH